MWLVVDVPVQLFVSTTLLPVIVFMKVFESMLSPKTGIPTATPFGFVMVMFGLPPTVLTTSV